MSNRRFESSALFLVKRFVSYTETSDLFVFPTLSDAFGLTQLECMAWKTTLGGIEVLRRCGPSRLQRYVIGSSRWRKHFQLFTTLVENPGLLISSQKTAMVPLCVQWNTSPRNFLVLKKSFTPKNAC